MDNSTSSFRIYSGINVSHWLSQSDLHGSVRADKFTKDDILHITDSGFDHVRLPVDEAQLWLENGTADNEAFDLLNNGIYHCTRQNLRVIVDMHILKSHYFNDFKQPVLYTEKKELDHFASLWSQLNERLQEWSPDILAFEILNEPKAENNEDWNRVSSTIFNHLRYLDNSRTIILGSNWYCKTDTFSDLDVPNDNRQLLSFHFYDPMLVTHYRASWTNLFDYDGPINYPGFPVDNVTADSLAEPVRSVVQRENYYIDRNTIIEKIRPAIDKRVQTGINLYCGEFGCIRHTPHDIKCNWYRDVVSVFREFGIAFTHWDMRGDFGILNGTDENRDIIDILTKR